MEYHFLLTITGTENSEWQGRVTGQNDRVAEFQSVMGLLKLVKAELEEIK